MIDDVSFWNGGMEVVVLVVAVSPFRRHWLCWRRVISRQILVYQAFSFCLLGVLRWFHIVAASGPVVAQRTNKQTSEETEHRLCVSVSLVNNILF